MECQLPWIGGNCTLLCADHLENYPMYQGILIGGSAVVQFKMIIRLFMVFFGKSKPIQKQILLVCVAMSTLLAVQSIDPLGYRNLIPIWIDLLLTNLGICGGFIIIFLLTLFLNRVKRAQSTKISLFQIIVLLMIIAVTCALTLLQISYPVLRFVKLCIFAVLTCVIMIYLIWLLNFIRNTAAKNGVSSARMYLYMCLFSIMGLIVLAIVIYVAVFPYKSQSKTPCHIDFDDWAFPLLEIMGVIIVSSLMGRTQHNTFSLSTPTR